MQGQQGRDRTHNYQVQPVEGGWAIVYIAPAKSELTGTPKAKSYKKGKQVETPAVPTEGTPAPVPGSDLPAGQAALLTALVDAKVWEDKPLAERAEAWIPFASARDSEVPHGLPVRSLSGFTSGLIRSGFIATAWGDKHGLKHVIAVKITRAGLESGPAKERSICAVLSAVRNWTTIKCWSELIRRRSNPSPPAWPERQAVERLRPAARPRPVKPQPPAGLRKTRLEKIKAGRCFLGGWNRRNRTADTSAKRRKALYLVVWPPRFSSGHRSGQKCCIFGSFQLHFPARSLS